MTRTLILTIPSAIYTLSVGLAVGVLGAEPGDIDQLTNLLGIAAGVLAIGAGIHAYFDEDVSSKWAGPAIGTIAGAPSIILGTLGVLTYNPDDELPTAALQCTRRRCRPGLPIVRTDSLDGRAAVTVGLIAGRF